MDKWAFFILNIFVNSFFAFFTTAFLIEALLFLFRMRQRRGAAFLRMLPILKLPLDLFLYDFSRWSFAQGVNPLHCEEGTRTLSVLFGGMHSLTEWICLPMASGIQFLLPENRTFTIADMMGYSLPLIIVKLFALSFCMLTLVAVTKRGVSYYKEKRSLKSLTKDSRKADLLVANSSLNFCIQKKKLRILFCSDSSASPFVSGLFFSTIFIPASLSRMLSQKEYEAVLAHEMEHMRWKDTFVRLILDGIESLFWWIPTKWLHKKIEEGQEMACDERCTAYGVDPADLASALCKSAKKSQYLPLQVNPCLTKHPIQKRVKALLKGMPDRFKFFRTVFYILAAVIAFLMIFLGRFWTF